MLGYVILYLVIGFVIGYLVPVGKDEDEIALRFLHMFLSTIAWILYFPCLLVLYGMSFKSRNK